MFFHRLRLLRTLPVVGALLFAPCALAQVPAQPVPLKKPTLCLASDKGVAEFVREAHQIGGVNCVRVYQQLGDDHLAYANFPIELEKIFVVIDRFPVPAEGSTVLKDIVLGRFNQHLDTFIAGVERLGRRIVVAPMPEVNGFWKTAYGIYAPGNSPEDFAPAWEYLTDYILSRTDLVQFDLNLNRKSYKARGGITPDGGPTGDFGLFAQLRNVNYISFSSYNRRCLDNEPDKGPRPFWNDVEPAVRAMRQLRPGTRLGIAETSTTSLCGTNKSEWFAGLFEKAHEFEFVTFFFLNKVNTGETLAAWGLQNKDEQTMFRWHINGFRERVGIPTPKPFTGLLVRRDPFGNHIVLREGKTAPEWDFNAPWSVRLVTRWSDIDRSYEDAVNPDSGLRYGPAYNVLQFHWDQAVLWKTPDEGVLFGLGDELLVGPKVSVDVTTSDNKNIPWLNQTTVTGEVVLCKKLTGFDHILYGDLCGYAGLQMIEPHYDRLSPDGEWGPIGGFRLNFGGDWSKTAK